jgi:2-hydroxychromene-2-carboxylate isomerase
MVVPSSGRGVVDGMGPLHGSRDAGQWHPRLLPSGVFKAAGNTRTVTVSAEGLWMFDDLLRWVRRYGAPGSFVGPAMFFGQARLDFVHEAFG